MPLERTFEQWMQEVDRYIAAKLSGLESMDLPDWAWRDAYDDQMEPDEAAETMLEEMQEEF